MTQNAGNDQKRKESQDKNDPKSMYISETESVFTPEDIVAYKQYPNSTDVMYIVQYRTREAAEKAWQMVYHSKESIWARGERINQLNFLWLDNKILQNEMSFSFDQSQDYPAMIDDPVFNEVTILADLQQKWGLDVVKVNLFFMAQGELNGAGLITFDNTIDAEIHVIQLFGGNFSDFQMETCGRLIKCQMKLLDKDKSGGAKSKRMISGIEQIIGDHFQRLEQQQGKQLRTQAKEFVPQSKIYVQQPQLQSFPIQNLFPNYTQQLYQQGMIINEQINPQFIANQQQMYPINNQYYQSFNMNQQYNQQQNDQKRDLQDLNQRTQKVLPFNPQYQYQQYQYYQQQQLLQIDQGRFDINQTGGSINENSKINLMFDKIQEENQINKIKDIQQIKQSNENVKDNGNKNEQQIIKSIILQKNDEKQIEREKQQLINDQQNKQIKENQFNKNENEKQVIIEQILSKPKITNEILSKLYKNTEFKNDFNLLQQLQQKQQLSQIIADLPDKDNKTQQNIIQFQSPQQRASYQLSASPQSIPLEIYSQITTPQIGSSSSSNKNNDFVDSQGIMHDKLAEQILNYTPPPPPGHYPDIRSTYTTSNTTITTNTEEINDQHKQDDELKSPDKHNQDGKSLSDNSDKSQQSSKSTLTTASKSYTESSYTSYTPSSTISGVSSSDKSKDPLSSSSIDSYSSDNPNSSVVQSVYSQHSSSNQKSPKSNSSDLSPKSSNKTEYSPQQSKTDTFKKQNFMGFLPISSITDQTSSSSQYTGNDSYELNNQNPFINLKSKSDQLVKVPPKSQQNKMKQQIPSQTSDKIESPSIFNQVNTLIQDQNTNNQDLQQQQSPFSTQNTHISDPQSIYSINSGTSQNINELMQQPSQTQNSQDLPSYNLVNNIDLSPTLLSDTSLSSSSTSSHQPGSRDSTKSKISSYKSKSSSNSKSSYSSYDTGSQYYTPSQLNSEFYTGLLSDENMQFRRRYIQNRDDPLSSDSIESIIQPQPTDIQQHKQQTLINQPLSSQSIQERHTKFVVEQRENSEQQQQVHAKTQIIPSSSKKGNDQNIKQIQNIKDQDNQIISQTGNIIHANSSKKLLKRENDESTSSLNMVNSANDSDDQQPVYQASDQEQNISQIFEQKKVADEITDTVQKTLTASQSAQPLLRGKSSFADIRVQGTTNQTTPVGKQKSKSDKEIEQKSILFNYAIQPNSK